MEETKEERIEYKIYQIVCNETGEVYFGKTTKTLHERLCKHKSSDCSSKQIIERGNYYIEQIDSTFDEEESIILERFYIETFKCVNEVIPGRTQKEYREEHKDEIKKYMKIYREENSEYFKEYNKKYREENSEYLKEYDKKRSHLRREYHREWAKKHKEEISEKGKVKYTCECGSTIRIDNKARHERTQKHIDYINSKK